MTDGARDVSASAEETRAGALLNDQKANIRRQALENRRNQADKDVVSGAILERLAGLPEYERASFVMFYVDARSEVRTRKAIANALQSDKTIILPWCREDGRLELFHLESLDELMPGKFGIPEPLPTLRTSEQRRVSVEQLDLVIVPGVAFDQVGGRIGHGKGYYDKLLGGVRDDAILVAVCFECQLFDAIPMASHDVFMDQVVTEAGVYVGRRHMSRGDENI